MTYERESPVETHLCKEVKARGGLCEKIIPVGGKGKPDRLITWPLGAMRLVETKAPKGRRSGAQIRDHARRARLRVRVFTLHTKSMVDDWIRSEEYWWTP